MQRPQQVYESFLDDEELVKQLIEATDVDEVVERMEIERYHHIAPLLRETLTSRSQRTADRTLLSPQQQRRESRYDSFPVGSGVHEAEATRSWEKTLGSSTNPISPPPPPENLSPIDEPLKGGTQELGLGRRYRSSAAVKTPPLSKERKRLPPAYSDQKERSYPHRSRRGKARSSERLRPPKNYTSKPRPISPANPKSHIEHQPSRSKNRKPPLLTPRRLSPQAEGLSRAVRSPYGSSLMRSTTPGKSVWRGVKIAQRYIDLFAPPAPTASKSRSPLRRIKGGYIAPPPPPEGWVGKMSSARKRPLSPSIARSHHTPQRKRHSHSSSNIGRWGRMINGYESDLTDATERAYSSDDAFYDYTSYGNYVIIPPRVVERERLERRYAPTMSPTRHNILVSPCGCCSTPNERKESSNTRDRRGSPGGKQQRSISPQGMLSPAAEDSQVGGAEASVQTQKGVSNQLALPSVETSDEKVQPCLSTPEVAGKEEGDLEAVAPLPQTNSEENNVVPIPVGPSGIEKTPREDGHTEKLSTKSASPRGSTCKSTKIATSSESHVPENVATGGCSKAVEPDETSSAPDSVTHTYRRSRKGTPGRKTEERTRFRLKSEEGDVTKLRTRGRRQKGRHYGSSSDQSHTSDSDSYSGVSSEGTSEEFKPSPKRRHRRRYRRRSHRESRRKERGVSAANSEESPHIRDVECTQMPKVYPPLTTTPQRIRRPVCIPHSPAVRQRTQSMNQSPVVYPTPKRSYTPEPFVSLSMPQRSQTSGNGFEHFDNIHQGAPFGSVRVVPPPSPSLRRDASNPSAPRVARVKVPYMSYLPTSSQAAPAALRATSLSPQDRQQQAPSAAAAANPPAAADVHVQSSSGRDNAGQGDTKRRSSRGKWYSCTGTDVRTPEQSGPDTEPLPRLQAHEWISNGKRLTTTRQLPPSPRRVTNQRPVGGSPQRPSVHLSMRQ